MSQLSDAAWQLPFCAFLTPLIALRLLRGGFSHPQLMYVPLLLSYIATRWDWAVHLPFGFDTTVGPEFLMQKTVSAPPTSSVRSLLLHNHNYLSKMARILYEDEFHHGLCGAVADQLGQCLPRLRPALQYSSFGSGLGSDLHFQCYQRTDESISR